MSGCGKRRGQHPPSLEKSHTRAEEHRYRKRGMGLNWIEQPHGSK